MNQQFMKIRLFTLVMLIPLMACLRKDPKCSYVCSEVDFAISLSMDFTGQEIDTVIVKRYSRGSNFMQLHSTTIFYDGNVDPYGGLGRFSSHYDYLVQMPSVTQSYSITEIMNEGKATATQPCSSMGCSNNLVSHKINGQLFSGYSAFIHP